MQVYSRDSDTGSFPQSASMQRWLPRPRPLAFLLLLLLAGQFLVGVITNLYVQIPVAHPGSNADNYFAGVVQGVIWSLAHGEVALRVHAIVGLLLFLGALLLLAVSVRGRTRAWVIVAVLGLIGIMAAGFNGASFLNYGHDFSSLLMSLGFVIALVAYLVGLYIAA